MRGDEGAAAVLSLNYPSIMGRRTTPQAIGQRTRTTGCGPVAELADAHGLGPCPARGEGSSPFRPTAVPAARRPTEISRKQDASKMEAEDHMDRPDFPTMEQVEKATHEQLARWYRFLPSGDTKEQQKIQDHIAERFKELGGMNPALSKKIGF
jgi:hypothetical protein